MTDNTTVAPQWAIDLANKYVQLQGLSPIMAFAEYIARNQESEDKA